MLFLFPAFFHSAGTCSPHLQDPYLDNVFDGEEGSRGIRFFTHGYDVYTPSKVLVTHDYHGHQGNPIVHTWGHGMGAKEVVHESSFKWFETIEKLRDRLTIFGSTRVNLMLGIGSKSKKEEDFQGEIQLMRNSLFGLGNKRTLEQAVEFTGINLKERKMAVNKCGNLEWVPFEESPMYGIAETLSRGFAGEDVPQFVVTPDIRDSNMGGGGKVISAAVADVTKGLRSGLSPEALSADGIGNNWIVEGLVVMAVVIIVVRILSNSRWKDDKHKK